MLQPYLLAICSRHQLTGLFSLAFLLDSSALAQNAVIVEGDPADIVVNGRQAGTARGDPQPIDTIGSDRLQSSRGLTIEEVITRLSLNRNNNPQILVNGRLADGAAAVGGLPSDAIERIEILPPSTAISYGGQAEGNVINIVLRSQFRAVQLSGQIVSQRNIATPDLNGTVQRTVIDGNRHTSFSASISRAVPRRDLGDYAGQGRFVAPGLINGSINAQVQRPVSDNAFLSVSTAITRERSELPQWALLRGSENHQTNDRLSWTFGSVISADYPLYNYNIRSEINSSSDDQNSLFNTSRNRKFSALVSASGTVTLFTFQRGSIRTTMEGSWRSTREQSSQIIDGTAASREEQTAHLDGRAGIALQWSNGRNAGDGTLTGVLGLDALRTGGSWGQSMNGSVNWMVVPRLMIGANASARYINVTQLRPSRPLSERLRIFDFIGGIEREVLVLRDNDRNAARIESNFVDAFVNYTVQGRLPFNLSFNLGRSSDGGLLDRPEVPSFELQLRQPIRYIRDADGALTIINLRTRRRAPRSNYTFGIQGNIRVPLSNSVAERRRISTHANGETGVTDEGGIVDAEAVLNVSFRSQWLFVNKLNFVDDGFDEPVNRTNIVFELTRRRSSVSFALNRVSTQQTRDIDGALFDIPATIYGAIEIALPLGFTLAEQRYMNTTQLRISVRDILVHEATQSGVRYPQNRFSAANQRRLAASLALSASF